MSEVPLYRHLTNMAHVRQSMPHSGLDVQVEVLIFFELFLLRSEADTPDGQYTRSVNRTSHFRLEGSAVFFSVVSL